MSRVVVPSRSLSLEKLVTSHCHLIRSKGSTRGRLPPIHFRFGVQSAMDRTEASRWPRTIEWLGEETGKLWA